MQVGLLGSQKLLAGSLGTSSGSGAWSRTGSGAWGSQAPRLLLEMLLRKQEAISGPEADILPVLGLAVGGYAVDSCTDGWGGVGEDGSFGKCALGRCGGDEAVSGRGGVRGTFFLHSTALISGIVRGRLVLGRLRSHWALTRPFLFHVH